MCLEEIRETAMHACNLKRDSRMLNMLIIVRRSRAIINILS
jgi:hypothetical protein